MQVEFEKDYLAELYQTGKCKNKKYRFQPSVIKRYKNRIDTLILASKIEDLYQLNSLNYEVLKGNKKEISSIRIDKQYRLESAVLSHSTGEIFITVCSN